MAIRTVVTRGYGSGSTIAFVVSRGFSIGVVPAPVAGNRTKKILFTSESASVTFSAVQSSMEFSSASKLIVIVDGPDFLSRLLQEDGFVLLKEDGGALLKEQE